MGKEAKIISIEQGSIAEEIGLEVGDMILSINGEEHFDYLVYRYLMMDEVITLCVQKTNGEVEEIELEKAEGEDLGLTFLHPYIEPSKSCHNKCIFCFIDQLPKGMRAPLYFKDDDARLSFLQGNYVTLTNMSEREIERIIRYRISPINISIHTTDPQLRVKMLHNKNAGKLYDIMQRFAQNNIRMNGQIVLCKGVNDGEALDKTLRDVGDLYPMLQSMSVVPVGLSRHRQGLYALEPITNEDAKAVIRMVHGWQETFIKRFDTRFCYLGDEWYLLADESIPAVEAYEDFPQIENGVGLIASLRDEIEYELDEIAVVDLSKREVTIATGVLAAPFIKEMVELIKQKGFQISVKVIPITNHFFGELVTVAGLVTGQDLIAQARGNLLGDELLIPSSMLRHEGDCFLDDITPQEVETVLGVKLTTVDNTGSHFVKKVLRLEN